MNKYSLVHCVRVTTTSVDSVCLDYRQTTGWILVFMDLMGPQFCFVFIYGSFHITIVSFIQGYFLTTPGSNPLPPMYNLFQTFINKNVFLNGSYSTRLWCLCLRLLSTNAENQTPSSSQRGGRHADGLSWSVSKPYVVVAAVVASEPYKSH